MTPHPWDKASKRADRGFFTRGCPRVRYSERALEASGRRRSLPARIRAMARQILLIVLGALLLAAAWRYLLPISGLGKDRDPTEPTTALGRPSGVAAKQVHPGNQAVTLDLARLDFARPPSADGRDPWRFQDPPRRKPQAERASTPSTRQPPSSTPPLADAKPPELSLEYLGHFGPPDKKVAVLSDGKRTFYALEGDVIGGRFIVDRLGDESVEIRLVGFPGGPAQQLGVRRR
jgi:hypothetical protein